MKRNLLLIAVLILFSFTANAQLKKVYKTKTRVGKTLLMSGTIDGNNIVAGVKNFNVVHTEDGKMLMNLKYSKTGSSVKKPYVVSLCDPGIMVLCNSTTVSAINPQTGKKVWENKDFKNIGKSSIPYLNIYGKYIFVSDKKGNKNYSLSALDANNGNVLWSWENRKFPVYLGRTLYSPFNNMLCIIPGNWSDRKNAENIWFINMETGKVELTVPVSGWITQILDSEDGYFLMHSYIKDNNTSVTCINLKEKKVQWESKLTNETKRTPDYDLKNFYVSLNIAAGKLIVANQGIEALDLSTGKSVYNIPYKPYVTWGVGDYIDAVFQPIVAGNDLVIADAKGDDIAIKKIDAETGKEIWSTGELKNMNTAPHAYVTNNTVVVQFGGAVTFEVLSKTGIGKLNTPGAMAGIDLATGQVKWNLNKETCYSSDLANDNTVVAFGVKNLQLINVGDGSVIKSQKEPFKETYFMTKVGLSKTRYQKDAFFDMANSCVYTNEKNAFVKYKF